MSLDCRQCGSPDGCEDCGLCWHCGPPCVDDQRATLEALSEGSATTWDVWQALGGYDAVPFRSTAQIRRRLRTLEDHGLVDHKKLIGPPGFCTFEWFLTDAGSAALNQSEAAK